MMAIGCRKKVDISDKEKRVFLTVDLYLSEFVTASLVNWKYVGINDINEHLFTDNIDILRLVNIEHDNVKNETTYEFLINNVDPEQRKKNVLSVALVHMINRTIGDIDILIPQKYY